MAQRNENDIVLKIGSFNPFVHSKTMQSFSIKVADEKGQGGVDILLPNWGIVNANFFKDPKEYNSIEPMRINLSRRVPEIKVYRDQLNEYQLDAVVALLRRDRQLCDLNDPTQYDRIGMVKSIAASKCEYWFEDLRKTKKENVNTHKETAKIGAVITGMSTDSKKMRDALYIIGQEPTSTMTMTDLENLLWEKVTVEGSAERKAFVGVFLEKNVNEKRVDAIKYFKKGFSLGIITNRAGVFILGDDRIGTTEDECISYLLQKEQLFKFLLNQVAAKSTFEEDIDEGRKVTETANGKSAEKESVDAQWKFLKNAFQEKFGFKNAGAALKGMTLEQALAKYADECGKLGEDNDIPNAQTLAKLAV